MKFNLGGLTSLCEVNVVEIKFDRRRPQGYAFPFRRMLCTRDPQLLFSDLGKKILNSRVPTGPKAYDTASRNLLTVWDILMQDWRNIPVESANVIATVSTRPAEEFWKYFDKVIRKMSSQQKISFMNK